MLDKQQLDKYCLPNGGYLRCIYLAQDDMHYDKFYCLKKSPKKIIVDKEHLEVLELLKKKNKDPQSQGIALGNNCSGFLLLKNTLQGFDVKGSK
jgi:hypothetical protein